VRPVPLERVLEAVEQHLASRHVCTLATSHQDVPWAATSFYVACGLDLVVCQGRRARTLANMLANPRTAFAVDDRRADAWLQGLGLAERLEADEERRAREALQRVAPEFTHHFTNPDYPVLRIRVQELTFADRPHGIYPRQRLVRQGERWAFGD